MRELERKRERVLRGLAKRLTESPISRRLGLPCEMVLDRRRTWQPCDPPAGNPCSPYPGAGIDLEAIMAHSWGHALGHNDLASQDDRLLTDYGGVPIRGPSGETLDESDISFPKDALRVVTAA